MSCDVSIPDVYPPPKNGVRVWGSRTHAVSGGRPCGGVGSGRVHGETPNFVPGSGTTGLICLHTCLLFGIHAHYIYIARVQRGAGAGAGRRTVDVILLLAAAGAAGSREHGRVTSAVVDVVIYCTYRLGVRVYGCGRCAALYSITLGYLAKSRAINSL